MDANGTATDSLKNAVRRSTEEVEFARSVYNTARSDADAAYNAYAAVTPLARRRSKRHYFEDQGYDLQIEAAHGRLASAVDTFKVISASLADPDIDLLKNAFVKYDNPRQQVDLPISREVLGQPDLWQKYYISLIGKDIDAFLRERNPQLQDIMELQSTSQTFESRWRASVSVKFLGLFRAGGASAEQVRREEHVRNNATRISISFANLDTFDIVRGEWFDGNAISRFGPRLPADPYKAVFGQNGQLELIPKTLLVGRGMKFSIYADSSSLDYMYEHFNGSADAGVRLGWFTIGAGGGYSSTKTETRVTKFADHIEFEDRSGRAKVIAVLAKRYGATPPPGIGHFAATVTPPARPVAIPEWTPSVVLNQALSKFSATERANITER